MAKAQASSPLEARAAKQPTNTEKSALITKLKARNIPDGPARLIAREGVAAATEADQVAEAIRYCQGLKKKKS